MTYPTLLKGFQAPTLRVYPVYAVIAEKYQAMVMLRQANSHLCPAPDRAAGQSVVASHAGCHCQ